MEALAAALDSPLPFHPAAVRLASTSSARPSMVKIFAVTATD